MKEPRSFGPTLVAERRGKHGRRRGKRLAIRQLSERARSQRQLQNRVVEGLIGTTTEWNSVRRYVAPRHPDGRTIR